MENMKIWDKLKQPPASALKQIQAGRLKGKSDISPQWRYQAMTEVFGACGSGWKYTIDRLWNEPAYDGQVFAFAQVSVQFALEDDGWSEPIQGLGGSMLIAKESAGLHASDEGYKMAVTDALGTAMKMIGMAADVYSGKWDGSKYNDSPVKGYKPVQESAPKSQKEEPKKKPPETEDTDKGTLSAKDNLKAKMKEYLKGRNADTDNAFKALLVELTEFPGKDRETGELTGRMVFIDDMDDKKFSDKWALTSYGKLKKLIEQEVEQGANAMDDEDIKY